MNRTINAEEVRQAIFQIGLNKASGPKGLPPFFFQKNLGIVGESVVNFVQKPLKLGNFRGK